MDIISKANEEILSRICIIFQQRYKIIVNSNKFIFMIPWFSFLCYVHFAINEMNLYHNIFHRNNAEFSQNIKIPKIYRVKKLGKQNLYFVLSDVAYIR